MNIPDVSQNEIVLKTFGVLCSLKLLTVPGKFREISIYCSHANISKEISFTCLGIKFSQACSIKWRPCTVFSKGSISATHLLFNIARSALPSSGSDCCSEYLARGGAFPSHVCLLKMKNETLIIKTCLYHIRKLNSRVKEKRKYIQLQRLHCLK